MATKIINSKTNNYERERDQEVVVEEYSPRSFLYSLRAGEGSQVNNIRQTVIINLDENGQSDVKNINLGNYGDNEILYIQVNSSSIEHDSEQYANYNPVLFIHKDGVTEHIEASERGEGWSAFLVKQYNFTSAGNYELMFGLIETELATGNLANEYEIFLSNAIIGTVADTRINGAYYEELDNASVIDEDYHNFIHKQPIVLSLADNKLVITSAPVNINKGDRYSAYIELLGASEELEEYFLVGSVNDQYCFYKFTKDEDTYKTWIPEEWTATDERYNVWVVGRSSSKRYVSELFNFQANKTFLDQGYFDDEVMGTSTGERVVSISDQKLTLINTSALGGVYKIQYTGEEIQSLLDYVKNNVIDKFYSKAEIDSKFSVVDGNISHISTSISGINNQINTLTTKNSTLESGLSTVNETITQINTNIRGVNSQISTLTTRTSELEDELTTVDQSVQCPHRYEITGNTGDEHGLAIDDQQMLLDRVQGRTLVKNQLIDKANLPQTQTLNGITFTNNGDGSFTINGTATSSFSLTIKNFSTSLNGHKIIIFGCPSGGGADKYRLYIEYKTPSVDYINDFGNGAIKTLPSSTTSCYYQFRIIEGVTVSNLKFTPQLIDLTQKYGAGKEPTTVEQVLNDMQGYEEYDEGNFVHSKNNLISTGRNIWDEEWELGYLSTTTGADVSSPKNIRSKNFIRVLPNTAYRRYRRSNNTGSAMYILEYDINYNYVGKYSGTADFTTSGTTYYIKFYIVEQTTYENGICINVSDESFNGKYEPYQEDVMVVDRELKAFEYIDNITNEKANKGAFVDLGTLDYIVSSNNRFMTNIPNIHLSSSQNSLPSAIMQSSKYTPSSPSQFNAYDKSYYVSVSGQTYNFAIKDTDYTDAATFKAAMQGVMLYYETTTETREPLELPRGMTVWGNGMQIQKGTIPYLLTKTYSLSIGAQVKANIAIDKEQQDQINTLKTEHKELREDFDNTFSSQNVKRETSELVDYPSKELSYPNQQVTVDEIRGRSLNVNQLAKKLGNWGVDRGTFTNNVFTSNATYGGVNCATSNFINGRKYYIRARVKLTSNTQSVFFGIGNPGYGQGVNVQTSLTTDWQTLEKIGTFTENSAKPDNRFVFFFDARSSGWDAITIEDSIMVVDLTQMYGAGNEPTNVNQVLIDIDKFKVDGYLPYNLGELKDVEFSGVKSVGVNIFGGNKTENKQYVGNYYCGNDGILNNNVSYNCFVIDVKPNEIYYIMRSDKGSIGAGGGILHFLDNNNNFISYINSPYGKNGSAFQVPSNCYKLRISIDKTVTYDFMINVSNNAINGQYFPYEEDTYEIPKVDLRSAENVYNSLYPSKGKFVKRIGVVEDLSTLGWLYNTDVQAFYTSIANGKYGSDNAFMVKYSKVDVSGVYTIDKSFSFGSNFVGGGVCSFVVRDEDYTDVATFKQSLKGAKLYYELATPVESDITCPNNYKVWQYGTEMQLGNFPTTIVKDYSISILDQITKNVEVDRNQSDLIEKHNARLQTIENLLANLKTSGGGKFLMDEKYLINKSTLVEIADAIRMQKGTTNLINPADFANEITSITNKKEGYRVRYIDADGTILKEEYVQEGGTTTPPSNPNYDSNYLTFTGWNYDTTNLVVESDLDIGAVYETKDGCTYLFCRFTTKTGLTPTLAITGNVTIDWGDGTIDNLLTHTYTDWGEYIIKISGMTGFSTASNTYLMGSGILNKTVKKCYVASSITSIKNYTFYVCFNLSSIIIPNSVTSIGDSTFSSCRCLSSIIIPNSVTSIKGSTFSSCYNLSSITIPNSVTSIGASAFSECYNLYSITIPNSVTSIGSSAFFSCFNLSSIIIPNSVTSINDSAFIRCYSLSSITIPNSVTSIGASAFSYCFNLSSITIPNSVTSIGASAFENCQGLSSIIIPNSVTSIGNRGFSACYSLSSIIIPNSVTSIGASAFSTCYSLHSATLPSSVTSINKYIFNKCYSLSNIIIPNSVTSIGDSAFSNCYSLHNYVINCNKLPTLENTNVINNLNNGTIMWVNDDIIEDLKVATNWSTYADYMQPLSSMPQDLKEELGV